MGNMSEKPPQSALDLIDADSLLSGEERDIRDTVRAYMQSEIKPHVARWFETGELPARELAKGFGQMGLLGMHLEGYGCAGTSATAFVSVQGSLAMFAIWKFGSEEQKNEWLPKMAAGDAIGCFGLTEADFGSNPQGMLTNAKRSGGDWILNGSKMWITNGSIADVAIVWAQTADGISGFVVPTKTPGFSATQIKGKLSLRASVTSELVFQDVRLPASAILPNVTGLKGPMSCLNEARFGILFGVLGAARDCLEVATDYARSRIQFDKPIAAYQLTQEKLTNMALELQKSYLLAIHLGRLKDAKKLRPEQISLGKLNNVRETLEIARTARTILGANGVTLEYSVMRHANNLESVLTYEGTSEIHLLTIGQALTGISAFR
jgi:glutaryl-CoA dehydrogenase